MNAYEIIGKACVDSEFRNRLFSDLSEILAANALTDAERAGLTRITQATYRPKNGKTRSGDAAGGDGTVPNTLAKTFEEVGMAIAHMCPEPPCAWP
jgi:hypothetical protein